MSLATETGARALDRQSSRRLRGRRWVISPGHLTLAAIAVLYCSAVFVRTSQSMALSWDEVVYASQVVRDVPAASFSAPRSRGMPLLLAPIGVFTSSVVAIRVYLSLLAGVLMFAAFQPWLSIVDHSRKVFWHLPALAAGLFATLWMTVLYGTMGYPNLWLAFVLVAGIGYYYRAVNSAQSRGGDLARVFVSFAAASLLRPTDALAAAAPLVLASIAVRRWRKTRPPVALLMGLMIGWGAWIVEAYARFGGPLNRLRGGAEANEGGLTWSLAKHFDALDGPYLLCRPHEICDGYELSTSIWWIVLPVLVGVGLYAARRRGQLNLGLVATGCAVTLTLPYLTLIDYAAPRFLMPAYALLALPTAYGVLWFVDRRRPQTRVLAAGIAVALFLVHLGFQQIPFGRANELVTRVGNAHAKQAEYLRETEGIRSPCMIVGEGAIQQGYLLRCTSHAATAGSLPRNKARILAAVARGEQVIVRLRADDELPDFMVGWRRIALPGTRSYVVYVAAGV